MEEMLYLDFRAFSKMQENNRVDLYSSFGYEVVNRRESYTERIETDAQGNQQVYRDVLIDVTMGIRTDRQNFDALNGCFKRYQGLQYQLEKLKFKSSYLPARYYVITSIISFLFLGIPIGFYVAQLMGMIDISWALDTIPRDGFKYFDSEEWFSIYIAIIVGAIVTASVCGIIYLINNARKTRSNRPAFEKISNDMQYEIALAKQYL